MTLQSCLPFLKTNNKDFLDECGMSIDENEIENEMNSDDKTEMENEIDDGSGTGLLFENPNLKIEGDILMIDDLF